jgi:hypothetical protein
LIEIVLIEVVGRRPAQRGATCARCAASRQFNDGAVDLKTMRFRDVRQLRDQPVFRQLLGAAAPAANRDDGGNARMVTVRTGDICVDGFESMSAAFFNQPIQCPIRGWRRPRPIRLDRFQDLVGGHRRYGGAQNIKDTFGVGTCRSWMAHHEAQFSA